MVGSPGQTPETLAEDFLFLKELNPEMVGIGPFIAHKDTPFGDRQNGSMEKIPFLSGAYSPSSSKKELASCYYSPWNHPSKVGAWNSFRGKCSDAEFIASFRAKTYVITASCQTETRGAECVDHLKKRMEAIGCKIVIDRGDYKK